MTQTVTITNLRNNIFDLLSAVEKGEKVLDVEKNGKKIATICGYVEKKIDWEQYKKDIEKATAYLRKNNWNVNQNFRKSFKFKKW